MTSEVMRAVYGTEELDELPRDVRLGVIGNPIAHSRSPQMQQAALDAMGEPCRYTRLLSPLEDGGFETLLAHLERCGFIGCNITVPFKKNAFAAACRKDALATLSGAVNTLVRREDGWWGYNTDGPGFEQAVFELCGKRLAELNVLILGACGGAGSALSAQCVLSGCPSLTLVNRPKPALEALADRLRGVARGEKAHTGSVRTCPIGHEELPACVEAADLVVNCTSLGLKDGDPLPVDIACLRPGQVVYDIVPHDTPLRRAASSRGCRAADGTDMLLWQGAYAYRHWFGYMPPLAPMRAALAAGGC